MRLLEQSRRMLMEIIHETMVLAVYLAESSEHTSFAIGFLFVAKD